MAVPPDGDLPPTNPNPQPTLNRQERALYQALIDKDPRLGSMYLGAMVALGQIDNPEYIVHAAHSIREVLDKLPAYINLAVPDTSRNVGDEVNLLAPSWNAALTSTCYQDGSWQGSIDRPLEAFLKRLAGFFEWFSTGSPKRQLQAATAMREMDPLKRALPTPIEKIRAKEWVEHYHYFSGVAHHNPDTTEFMRWKDALERFILDILRPRAFDDQAELDALIQEGERHGK